MARADPVRRSDTARHNLFTHFITNHLKITTMNIVYYFICASMQDRRALVKHLLTMQISFFYDGDTERIMIDGIDETRADKIAQGAKTWGAESPIRVEADYLTF